MGGIKLKEFLITVSHKATIENYIGLRAESEEAAVNTVVSMANTEGVEDFKILSVQEVDALEMMKPSGTLQ